jgi:hypothetical protein
MKLGCWSGGLERLPGLVFRPDRSVLTEAAARELRVRGIGGRARVLRLRGPVYVVEVTVSDDAGGEHRYRTRLRDASGAYRRARIQPGDTVDCRVDPGDHRRVLLRAPDQPPRSRSLRRKVFRPDRRRADAVLLAVTATGEVSDWGEPVVRLDLELTARGEPTPWRVRVCTPAPLSAVAALDIGGVLPVRYDRVDDGDSVVVDWPRQSR